MKIADVILSISIILISFGLVHTTFFQVENKKIVHETYEQICCKNVNLITPFTINEGSGSISSLQKDNNNVIYVVTGKWNFETIPISNISTVINVKNTTFSDKDNRIEFSAKISLLDENGGFEEDYKVYNFNMINTTRIENTSTNNIVFLINGTASIDYSVGRINDADLLIQILDQKGRGFGKDRVIVIYFDDETLKQLGLSEIPIYGTVRKFSTNLPY